MYEVNAVIWLQDVSGHHGLMDKSLEDEITSLWREVRKHKDGLTQC